MSKHIDVLSPYDGSHVGTAPVVDADRMEGLLRDGHALAADPSRAIPVPDRIALLVKTAAVLEGQFDRLVETCVREGGKPITDVRAEVRTGIHCLKTAAETLATTAGAMVPMGTTPGSANRLAFTVREPVGLVAAVSAFNHPFALIAQQVVPALAVGCPVVVKPAAKTPLSCLNFVAALTEAGWPDGWCRAAVCDNEVAGRMTSDRRIAFLSFVGSAAVGWKLRSTLAPGAACALEHGGAAPVVIDADVDVTKVVPQLVRGAFYHAGQVCVSVQRVFAHHDVYDELVAGLREKTPQVVVGDPLKEETQVGPMISEKEVERVGAWVEEAVRGGAGLAAGGKPVSRTAYAPTVLLDPPPDAKVSREEVFGPVVCVYKCGDVADAIRRANDVPFCFQAAVFSRNIDVCLAAAKRLSAVTVLVNDQTAFRTDWMPFGGRRHSGLGLGGIVESMKEMSFEKLVILKSESL